MTTSDIFANQRKIWKDYEAFYTLARRSLPFIAGVVIGGLIFASDPGYITNLYTEIISILATVGILNFFSERREIENLKKHLIREAGSRSNATAKSAVEWLRAEGLLTGNYGVLQNQNLEEANLKDAPLRHANLQETNLLLTNLQNADLSGANLQRAYFWGANLQETKLYSANLEGANLEEANLKYAKLENVNLKDANLYGVILEEAYLAQSNLEGANLEEANLKNATLWGVNLGGSSLKRVNLSKATLQGANLSKANLYKANLSNAWLPDGTKWTSETDMTRFTDPDHSDFWQPSDNDDSEENLE